MNQIDDLTTQSDILDLLKTYFPGASWRKQQTSEASGNGSYVGKLPIQKGDLRLYLKASDTAAEGSAEGSCLILVKEQIEGGWVASAPEWATTAQTAAFQTDGGSMRSAVEAAVAELHRQVTIIADALTGGLFGIQIQPVTVQECESKAAEPEPSVQEGVNSSHPSRAKVHSDDYRYEAEFDAADWFYSASPEQIQKLIDCGWGGDYAADAVAEHCQEPHPKGRGMEIPPP